MKLPIYLDHHATTPVDPKVLEEMLPYFQEQFGNASSIDHYYGNQAQQAVEKARRRIAELINADSDEIIFTSGATESNNLALFGIAEQYKEKGKHIITCTTEHKSVLDPCKKLELMGFRVTYLKVNSNGEIDLNALTREITNETILISIMAANNEIGTIHPLQEIGEIALANNIFFHSDAAQTFGHALLDVKKMRISLMSISGHKIYGPKGVGVLYVKREKPITKLAPLFYGGGHERGFRPGTLNVPGIVGLGKAAEIARKNPLAERVGSLRDRLFNSISSKVKVEINGNALNKLSHNLNVYFEGVEAKALINEVKDRLAISAGSACTTNDVSPSHVLKAIGYDDDRAYSSVRFGLGRFTALEEIEETASIIINAVVKLRNL